MNLLQGPDANTYEIAAFVAMLESILVGAVVIYANIFSLIALGGPKLAPLLATPLVTASAAGLVICFRHNRSRRPQIAALTILCALVIPGWTLLYTAKLNFVVLALIAPGLLLSLLSIVKIIQLRTAPR